MHCLSSVYSVNQCHTTTDSELAASFVVSDCYIGLIQLDVDVLVSLDLFCLLSVAKFDVSLTVNLGTSVCNENQIDALFILSVFRHSTSTFPSNTTLLSENLVASTFDIHMSVHRNIIPNYSYLFRQFLSYPETVQGPTRTSICLQETKCSALSIKCLFFYLPE